jgi:hypothetical protein
MINDEDTPRDVIRAEGFPNRQDATVIVHRDERAIRVFNLELQIHREQPQPVKVCRSTIFIPKDLSTLGPQHVVKPRMTRNQEIEFFIIRCVELHFISSFERTSDRRCKEHASVPAAAAHLKINGSSS